MSISMIVHITPRPQPRPRFVRRGRFMKAYDPKSAKIYKAIIRKAAAEVAPKEPWDGPVALVITFHMPIPKSWSKKVRGDAEEKVFFPIAKKRNDIDNLIKGVMDALDPWWVDDSQVVTVKATKVYSSTPKIIISASLV